MDQLQRLAAADPAGFWGFLQVLRESEAWLLRHFAGRGAGAVYAHDPGGVMAHLERLALDPDFRVREGAAAGLAAALSAHFREIYPALAAWVRHPEARLRALVLMALIPAARPGNLPAGPLFGLLEPVQADGAPEVARLLGRFLVGGALAAAYPGEALACVQAMAARPERAARWHATQALCGPLSRLYPGEAAALLGRLAAAGDERVRQGVGRTVRWLARQPGEYRQVCQAAAADPRLAPLLGEGHDQEG